MGAFLPACAVRVRVHVASRRFARVALALGACTAFAASTAACDNWPPKGTSDGGTSSSRPPASGPPSPAVIDAVDLSATASVQGNVYPIYGSITFHDDAGKVRLVRMRVPVIGKVFDYNVGDIESANGLGIQITLSADPPLTSAGDTNLQFTLVDTTGAETSPPVLKTVDLL
jgi:hypothetical protein